MSGEGDWRGLAVLQQHRDVPELACAGAEPAAGSATARKVLQKCVKNQKPNPPWRKRRGGAGESPKSTQRLKRKKSPRSPREVLEFDNF